MNSVMNTRLFTAIDKSFDVVAMIRSANSWINKYTVDKDKYDYLMQISKTFKFSLVSKVVKSLEVGLIRPLLLADPKNKEDKKITFPTSISCMLLKDASGKTVSYVDTSQHSHYNRVKLTGEVEAFAMSNERQFYALMQRGFVARSLQMNAASYDTTPRFVKAVVNAYARMMAKPISAVYATGAKDEWMQKLLYVTIVFALQNFFNYEQEKARLFAMSFPGINRAYIMENSKYYNCQKFDFVDMTPAGVKKAYPNDNDLKYPVDVYVQILKTEFEEMRNGKIEFRTVLDRYTSMYGQNSMMAIEHCESFINMLLTADLKTNFYNDLGILQIAKMDIDVILAIINGNT
ncbi:MAG: hypothetical protein ACRC5M_04315 [Anaeroplasmataceae bacterium]